MSYLKIKICTFHLKYQTIKDLKCREVLKIKRMLILNRRLITLLFKKDKVSSQRELRKKVDRKHKKKSKRSESSIKNREAI
jgi:hypothetical protein